MDASKRPSYAVSRFITISIVLLLVVFYGSFFTHSINLTTSDLGRHLKNGELFFQTWHPIATNFYSYTEPDNPVVNHHWGVGALFYLIGKSAGFTGVQIAVIVLNVAAFLISFLLASRRAGVGIAALIALVIIPILGTRTELRPESFSYLFAIIFFFILIRFRDNLPLSYRSLFILPILECVWVNAHIYFFLGPLIVLAFLIEAAIIKPLRRNTKKLALTLGATVAAGFISPFGIQGVTAPFTILKQYGYLLVENQSVWFLEKLMTNPSFTVYKFAFAFLMASFVPLIVLKLRKKETGSNMYIIASFFLAIGVSVMAWLQIRNFALFGFFALPITAANINAALPDFVKKYEYNLAVGALMALMLTFLITVSGALPSLFPYWQQFGFGVQRANSASADFFKREHLKGPILNNYDIGGYLIFHFFPGERVFVDNRPEAYSVDFFQHIYVPLQDDEADWKENLNRYQFNIIFFSYHDFTPWAQKFLIQRVADPEWVPVFVDDSAIILARNNEENRHVIEQYAIPRERFIARPN